MSEDRPEAPPMAALAAALHVRRNVILGTALGLALGLGAYLVRVLELLGPVAGTRTYPLFGASAWFLLLSFVLAVTSALLITAVLTLLSAVWLIRTGGPPTEEEPEDRTTEQGSGE